MCCEPPEGRCEGVLRILCVKKYLRYHVWRSTSDTMCEGSSSASEICTSQRVQRGPWVWSTLYCQQRGHLSMGDLVTCMVTLLSWISVALAVGTMEAFNSHTKDAFSTAGSSLIVSEDSPDLQIAVSTEILRKCARSLKNVRTESLGWRRRSLSDGEYGVLKRGSLSI